MRSTLERFSLVSLGLALLLVASACQSAGRCALGTEGCACDTGNTCDSGLLCTDNDRCAKADTVVCFDACQWNFDGVCDDGGPGSQYDACAYGSDCTDCRARPNTCTDPNYPTFCPNTAGTSDGPCWGPDIDCDSIAPCNGLNYGCGTGYRVVCDLSGNASCAANPCASNSWNRMYCDADPSTCFASLTDCTTVIDCGGTFQGCFAGETSACDTSNVFSCR